MHTPGIVKSVRMQYRTPMIVRVVQVAVKPEQSEQFEAATAENHYASLKEPGVVRFDVLRDDQNPGAYILYEMYRNSEAVLAHKETDHYATWRDTVGPMMETPRQGRDCTLLYPASDTV